MGFGTEGYQFEGLFFIGQALLAHGGEVGVPDVSVFIRGCFRCAAFLGEERGVLGAVVVPRLAVRGSHLHLADGGLGTLLRPGGRNEKQRL